MSVIAVAISPRTEAFAGVMALLMAFFLFGLGTLYFWAATRRYKAATEHLRKMEDLMARIKVTAGEMGILCSAGKHWKDAGYPCPECAKET